MKTALVSLVSAVFGIAIGILFAMCLKVVPPSITVTIKDADVRYPLEVFRKINEELPAKIDNDDIMVVVLPATYGDYTIRTSVRGLRARFSDKEWDKTFEWIRQRMGELDAQAAKAEPSASANGAPRRR